MYCFKKDMSAPKPSFRISFLREWKYFDFRGFLTHKKNRETFQKWFEEVGEGLPDFLAAVIAQAHHKSCLDKKFVTKALNYCRLMVEEIGYERIGLKELALADTNINHVIVVAGCQGETVRGGTSTCSLFCSPAIAERC
jgi:hypothetical protein